MAVRPYALLGAGTLAAVRGALDGAVDGWCTGWGIARHDILVTVERAWDSTALHAPAWRQGCEAEGKSLWLGWPQELPARLQQMMFAPDQRHGPQDAAPAPLAEGAAAAALEALAGAIAAALLDQPASTAGEPARTVWQHASGAVRFDVRIGKHGCTGVLDHAAVQAVAGRAGVKAAVLPPLAPVSHVRMLSHVPVRLRVDAGRAQVALGSLRGLAVDDVLRLDTLADRPLAVHGPNGAVLFGGHLGLAERQLALEVVGSKSISGN